MTVHYAAGFGATPITGYAYLMIYGWLSNPYIEYYIIENHAGSGYTPLSSPSTSYLGKFYSEGSIYDLGYSTRNGVPNVPGVTVVTKITTVYAVRKDVRWGGYVDISGMFQAWRAFGQGGGPASVLEWQILGCEAQGPSVYGKCIADIL